MAVVIAGLGGLGVLAWVWLFVEAAGMAGMAGALLILAGAAVPLAG